MNGKISLSGLLLGSLTALTAGLFVSHYSLAWLVVGVAVGIVLGAGLVRRSPANRTLGKGEQR